MLREETLILRRIPSERICAFLKKQKKSSCVSHAIEAATLKPYIRTTLPTWLPGETTPVGVLCFRNDSKDDLESSGDGCRVGARQEKLFQNEIRQSALQPVHRYGVGILRCNVSYERVRSETLR